MWIILVFSVVCFTLVSGDFYDDTHKAELTELKSLLSTLLSELQEEKAEATSGFCRNFEDKIRKELMDALKKKKGRVYIIFEDGYTCSSSEKDELSMYRELQHIGRYSSTQLWLSKAPCRDCINPLKAAFPLKPTLHVQSLYYGEASFENKELKSAVGCLYRVKESGFPVTTTWDWNARPFNLKGKKGKPDKMYDKKREAFGEIIFMIENLNKKCTSIENWCTD